MKGICRRSLFFVLILGIFFVSQTVLAEEKTEQKDPQKTEQISEDQPEQKDQTKTTQSVGQKSSHNLEEITVTGKRIGEPVTSPYAVAESSQLQTEVWTSEEIEALHPETVWDIIEQMPGMEVTYQGRQHMDFSNMRGTGNYGIILDGVYVSQIDRILETLPVDAIESMTIVRDSTALTLGPLTNFGSTTGDSNVGFIIIKTKRAAKKLEGGLVASHGSEHTEKEHLYQGAKIGNFDYRAAGTYNNTLGKTNWYDASRNESLLFRGGYARPDFEGDMLYYASRGMREFERREVLQPGGTAPVGTLDTSKWKIGPLISNMFASNLSKHWNDTHTTTFSYAYNSILVTSMTTNFPDGKGQKVTFSDQDSRSQSLSLRHVVTSQNNILKVGGQWNDQVFPAADAPSSVSRSDEDMFGLYAQDEYHMLNDRLTIDAGIRGDKELYSDSPVTNNPVSEWSRPVYAYTVGTAFKLIPATYPYRTIRVYGELPIRLSGQHCQDGTAHRKTVAVRRRHSRQHVLFLEPMAHGILLRYSEPEDEHHRGWEIVLYRPNNRGRNRLRDHHQRSHQRSGIRFLRADTEGSHLPSPVHLRHHERLEHQ